MLTLSLSLNQSPSHWLSHWLSKINCHSQTHQSHDSLTQMTDDSMAHSSLTDCDWLRVRVTGSHFEFHSVYYFIVYMTLWLSLSVSVFISLWVITITITQFMIYLTEFNTQQGLPVNGNFHSGRSKTIEPNIDSFRFPNQYLISFEFEKKLNDWGSRLTKLKKVPLLRQEFSRTALCNSARSWHGESVFRHSNAEFLFAPWECGGCFLLLN